jgi:bacillithiol biosynthesis cysteine-adding enzyme BshC
VVGGEDHDWEEVNHFHLFGRRYQWDRTSSGPCGRLSLEGLDVVIQTVTELFANTPFVALIKENLMNCLAHASNYSQFHQMLIHSLFGHQGLVVLNMDDPELKRAFIPIMEKEIREQFSFRHVTSTQSALETAGFKAQAFCRPVNLFYMEDQLRERLEPVEAGLRRVESGNTYTVEEMVSELHQHPERFSPNVILRPLYQESILPNLAFIGGGGEIAYWLERKSQFEAAGIHFPMLIRRNSLLLIDPATAGQMQKAGITWEDIILDYETLVKAYLKRNSRVELSFAEEQEMLKTAFENLAAKAEKIDPTLAKAILAEETKQSKQFEQLGSRLMRAEKQLQETNLKRIQKLKEKLFPENGLQERHENFLSFYAQYGPGWIDDMISLCNPLEEKFMIAELEA